jgi:hypothetical protein
MIKNDIEFPNRYFVGLNRLATGEEFDRSFRIQKDLALTFDAHARQMIISDEDLSANNIIAIKQLQKNMNIGADRVVETLDFNFDNVGKQLDDVSRGLKEINDTLIIGFSDITMSLDSMNDSLNELIRLIGNPSATWAVEQYMVAKDEVRRGLHEQALETVTRAIGGFGSNVGLATEYRFHMLKGAIELGEFKGQDQGKVSFSNAEQSFLFAERCSSSDNPKVAQQSLVLASRAAYLQNEPKRALAHLKACVAKYAAADLDVEFNIAKVSAAIGGGEPLKEHAKRQIFDSLVKLFAMKMEYSLLATSDGDLQKYGKLVRDAIQEAAFSVQRCVNTVATSVDDGISELQQFGLPNFYISVSRFGFNRGHPKATDKGIFNSQLQQRMADLNAIKEKLPFVATLPDDLSLSQIRLVFDEVLAQKVEFDLFVNNEILGAETALLQEEAAKKQAAGTYEAWRIDSTLNASAVVIFGGFLCLWLYMVFSKEFFPIGDIITAIFTFPIAATIILLAWWAILALIHVATRTRYYNFQPEVNSHFTIIKSYQAILRDLRERS